MRDTRERPDAVAAGVVKIIGTQRESIERETLLLLNDIEAYKNMASAVNPYGDGCAVHRIVEILKHP